MALIQKMRPDIIDLWADETAPETTPMRDFYRDKVIFLTGGTGFLGQLYVEKLLRCEVKTIYVLSRSKKGKSGSERLRELYSGALFMKLKKRNPNYMDRIRAIEGNTRELMVGLSDDDRNEIIENVHIILHAAADVRFDNTLKEISLVNLRGTRELLRLGEECKQLEMFAYISTAFSHCERKFIEEKFYEVPIDPEEMIRIAEYIEKHNEYEDYFNIITENFIHPWPNTYSFSKALSEELMRQYSNHLPIIVIRPSIVIATHEDPVPAWCNNIYGLNGMLVGSGLGFLRIMVFDEEMRGDIVCADYVTNSTLAAIWDRRIELDIIKHQNKNNMKASLEVVAENINKEKTTDKIQPMQPKIYNVTSKEDACTWGYISKTMWKVNMKYPTRRCIWVPLPNTTRYRFMEFFLVIFYHAIPGLIFDFVLQFKKTPQRLLPFYRKIQLFMIKLRYFMTQDWRFDNKNMYAVYDRMNEYDKKFFPSDVRKFDWDKFCTSYALGIMHYLGKDDLEDFGPARRMTRIFRIAHFFVLVFYYSLLGLFYFYLGRFLGINQLFSSYADCIKNIFE